MSITTEIQRLQNAKADIKTTIEEKGAEVGDGLIDTYAEKINNLPSTDEAYDNGYNEGYENGKNSVIDLGRYASTLQFNSSDWAKEETTLNLDRVTTLQNMWYGFKDYVVKHLIVNCQQPIKYMQRAFYLSADSYINPNYMERITLNVDTSQCRTFDQAFGYMYNLRIIDGKPLDCSSSTNNVMFVSVPNLEEVRFAKNTIKSKIQIVGKPSAETRQSAVDGLADLTGQETQTITFSPTYGAMLTEEQKATISTKNWTLVC